MSGICRLPLTSRFKGLKNVSDRNEKSCPICANRQDSHKWERLQTPSRIHSISHESRGQAPINHKHTETKECTMEQEQILNQCRNIARRKGLKIIRAKADGLFIINPCTPFRRVSPGSFAGSTLCCSQSSCLQRTSISSSGF